ncbi:MAG: GNAT family N-acetyltransferase [Betaproteobacteria bacterium]|nr:GNAT family N-acetyltransferase [Betaproteobacteria bacterium]
MLETLRNQESGKTRGKQRYVAGLARTAGEVREAQQLRYKVFCEEMGADLPSRAEETDRDEFDQLCKHLIVRDLSTLAVVGTYRILTPEAARVRGGYYADTEFDLARLEALRPTMAEVGRAAIHPDYRGGSVILMLWSGLAQVMAEAGYRYAIGCASIPLSDGHSNAVQVFRDISARALAPHELRVAPRHAYPLRDSHPMAELTAPKIPPLIKGYLRLGAWIGGEPAWDPAFGTADVFVLLPLSRMPAHYVRHFQAAA